MLDEVIHIFVIHIFVVHIFVIHIFVIHIFVVHIFVPQVLDEVMLDTGKLKSEAKARDKERRQAVKLKLKVCVPPACTSTTFDVYTHIQCVPMHMCPAGMPHPHSVCTMHDTHMCRHFKAHAGVVCGGKQGSETTMHGAQTHIVCTFAPEQVNACTCLHTHAGGSQGSQG